MTTPPGYTAVLVPRQHAAALANRADGDWYDLTGMPQFDEVRIGDRIKITACGSEDYQGKWGTVIGFGVQPLGEHYVVRVDGNPSNRQSFILAGGYSHISIKLDDGIYDDEVKVSHG